MLRNVTWWQAFLFYVIGAVFGQRWAHIHPIGSVARQNGGNPQGGPANGGWISM